MSSSSLSLAQFLSQYGLAHLEAVLAPSTPLGMLADCLANRPAFLTRLSSHHGIEKLADRQKLANALLRAVRESALPKLSTAADILRAIGDAAIEAGETTVLMPKELRTLSPDAPQRLVGIPRTILQTNKSRCVGLAAWRNVVRMLEANPEYSYHFADDEQCAALIREHFPAEVTEAFHSLKAGAAKVRGQQPASAILAHGSLPCTRDVARFRPLTACKAAQADLWRYCALYVHGGVYLDLDSSIFGPLDSVLYSPTEPGAAGRNAYFMYDAEANLIQWVLIAAPGQPVHYPAATCTRASTYACTTCLYMHMHMHMHIPVPVPVPTTRMPCPCVCLCVCTQVIRRTIELATARILERKPMHMPHATCHMPHAHACAHRHSLDPRA